MSPESLVRSLLRSDAPESPVHALSLLAGLTLCASLVVLVLAVWYQAVLCPKVDGQLVAALGILSGSVAALAGVVHLRSNPAQDAPR